MRLGVRGCAKTRSQPRLGQLVVVRVHPVWQVNENAAPRPFNSLGSAQRPHAIEHRQTKQNATHAGIAGAATTIFAKENLP